MSELKPILVIEAEAKDLEQTLAALASRPLANPILVARSCDEALRALQERGGAALVLLDVTDAAGGDTLRKVRESAPDAPVAALVAPGAAARVHQEHPWLAVIAKPLRPETLIGAAHDLGLALAIVGQAAPLGAYVPKGAIA